MMHSIAEDSVEEKKLMTLEKIANELNINKVQWALGGSLMLRLRGLFIPFHDIDIMVSIESADLASNCLMKLGKKMSKKPSEIYASKVFEEYIIDDVDVDLMSDIVIVKSGFNFSLEKEDINDKIEINNTSIYLHSIDKWLEFYKAIGREDKVLAIEKFYSESRK